VYQKLPEEEPCWVSGGSGCGYSAGKRWLLGLCARLFRDAAALLTDRQGHDLDPDLDRARRVKCSPISGSDTLDATEGTYGYTPIRHVWFFAGARAERHLHGGTCHHAYG
jgi:hypothetical protein